MLNGISIRSLKAVTAGVARGLPVIFLCWSFAAYGQFSPNPNNTTNCPPNACVPGCSDGGGGGGGDCTGPFCDPDSCDSTVQSCVDDPNPDPDPDPPCEGSDCGDNSCNGGNNTAANGSGAQNTSTANPINLISGNKYKRQEDLPALPGTLGLEFTRHYNSFISGNMGLGKGWRHSYATALQAPQGFAPGEAEYVRIQQSDGRIMRFHRVGSRNSKTQYATRNHADGFITTTEYGYQWRWRNGRMLSFDDRGLMTQIEQGQQRLTLSYSNGGQLLSVTDPQGRRLSLQYAQGLLIQITDPAGQETKYRYSYDKQLVKVIRPTGKERVYHYQDETRGWLLTGITDERGIRVESYGYDEHGRATVSTKGENTEKVSIEYEDGQRVVTNGLGESTVYVLGDVNGQKVIEEVRGPGCSACEAGDVAYQYNDALQVTKVEYKNGSAELFEYDARGRMVAHHRRMAAGFEQRLVARYGYEGSSHRPSLIERESVKPGEYHRTQMTYMADGQLASVKETGFAPATPFTDQSYDVNGFAYTPIQRSTLLNYDSSGRLVSIDGPRSDVQDVLLLQYNSAGLMASMTMPDGETQRILEYDALGRPTLLQTGQKTPTAIEYNIYGKPAKITRGLRVVQYEYNELGNLTAIVNPDGHRRTIDYDNDNRVTQITNHNGSGARFSFDDESRIVKREHFNQGDSIIDQVSYLYDADNRLQQVDQKNGEQIDLKYDQSGGLSHLVDQDNRVTRVGLSAIGRLMQVSNPESAVTLLHLDQTGNTVGLTDANRNTTIDITDDFGRVVKAVSDDKGITYFQHDLAGNVTAWQTSGGSLVKRQYDAANRVVRQTSDDDDIVLEYESTHGRLTKIQNKSSTDTFSYDADARLVGHTRILDDREFSTLYEYDPMGRLTVKTLPDGQTLRYHYYEQGDQKGALRAVTRDDWFGIRQTELLTELDDDASDNATRIGFGNGVSVDYQYGSLGRLESINTNQLKPVKYRYDKRGNIIGIELDDTQQVYQYDKVNRLVRAKQGSSEYGYSYDKVGNRTELIKGDRVQQLTYADKGNRLSAIDSKPLVYNQEGSPLEVSDAQGVKRYEYNALQRPVRLFVDGKLTAEYFYNGFGARVKKVVYPDGEKGKKISSYYLYDGRMVSAEVDADGDINRQYVYHDKVPAVLLDGKNAYFVQADHMGTPRVVTDMDQNIVWGATYEPFGNANVSVSKLTLNLRFPGQYFDVESGTHYNYFRDYDPQTGRYQTSDPSGIYGGINSYAYAYNNPIRRYDLLGLAPEAEPLPQGGYMITAEQYNELRELAEANRRPEYYMRLYELTEYQLFADMAQISSNSGFLGGVAWRANDIIVDDYSDIYPGDETMSNAERISDFSTIIFLYDFAQITHIMCSLDRQPIYGIPSELDMARAAYDGWLSVSPGFARIAPPLARLAQQLALEGNVTGLIELYLEVGGQIPPAILAGNPATIIGFIMGQIAAMPASGILAQSVAEETAAIAGDALPLIDDNRRGFYEDTFIADHGGMQNITVTTSADGRYRILSADRSLVTDPDRRALYEGVQSHPTRNVIVLEN